MDDEPLTAQECAEAIRGWVRQMPGGGEQYLDRLLDMIPPPTRTVLDDVAALRTRWRRTVTVLPSEEAMFDRIETWIREHS